MAVLSWTLSHADWILSMSLTLCRAEDEEQEDDEVVELDQEQEPILADTELDEEATDPSTPPVRMGFMPTQG